MTSSLSSTISPSDCSTSQAEMEKSRGSVESKSNTAENMKAAMELIHSDRCKLMSPVEESEEAITAKVLPSPSPPSRQEMLEHNITHVPFRNWCPHCLAGKAKSMKHMQGAGLGVSETPVVSMDYMFMGDRSKEADVEGEDEEVISDEKYEIEDSDDQKSKILVIRDAKSRVCAAIPVPKKGLDADGWSLKETLRFLEFLGYTNIVLKSDQEKALEALFNKVRTHRGDQTQTMREVSPVGDSKSNGFIERSIQSVQGQIRTMRHALEARLGTKIATNSPIFAWMAIHAANIVNIFEVGKDGRVPYQRLRGRRMQP